MGNLHDFSDFRFMLLFYGVKPELELCFVDGLQLFFWQSTPARPPFLFYFFLSEVLGREFENYSTYIIFMDRMIFSFSAHTELTPTLAVSIAPKIDPYSLYT